MSSLTQSLSSTEESDDLPSSSPPETDKTPERRSPNTARDGKISKRLKTTMYNHDISFKRCSVTNCRESAVVTLHNAHILHKSVKDNVLTVLEYWWQMRYKSLNVDSRDNIIRLSPEIHAEFDRSGWFFVPERTIVENFFTASRTLMEIRAAGNFLAESESMKNLVHMTVPNGGFIYDVIPSPHMKSSELFFHDAGSRNPPLPGGPSIRTLGGDIEGAVMKYPYCGLQIKSHIRPQFAIYNIGYGVKTKLTHHLRKWAKYTELAEYGDFEWAIDTLRLCVATYEFWEDTSEDTERMLQDWKQSSLEQPSLMPLLHAASASGNAHSSATRSGKRYRVDSSENAPPNPFP